MKLFVVAGSLTTELAAAIVFEQWGNEGAISASCRWYMGDDF